MVNDGLLVVLLLPAVEAATPFTVNAPLTGAVTSTRTTVDTLITFPALSVPVSE
jgi:hypothetical protein